MSKERIAILVTKDDSLASFVIAGLGQLGCTVLVTESPQRVIRSCSSNLLRPDLVIVDEKNYPKPNQDWTQLFQSVQKAGIPKILLTNRIGSFSEWDAVYDRYLINPLWKNQCLDLMNRELDAREMTSRPIWRAATVVYIKITDYGETQQQQIHTRLMGYIEEHFPEGIVYHENEDEYYLIISPDSVQEACSQIEHIFMKDCRFTLKAVEISSRDNMFTIMRKLFHDVYSNSSAILTEEVAATMEIAEIVETTEATVENVETIDTSEYKLKLFLGIIDDDPIVRKMLGEHFAVMPDIEIKTFREGESFLLDAWHQQNGHFLLIIDGNMPRIDGYEVVYRLRKEYDWNKYRILMLTGRKSEQDIVRAFELGVDDYLTKPFKLSELDARVKRYIQRWDR
ncbi:response regulator [Brevibacillus sp. SYSU BS000544]|uniref:response regulator n=1 Tax=Brevibacillus sp. SYSU BS000544 TaxID=3416443 RepID=UPI003CE4E29F